MAHTSKLLEDAGLGMEAKGMTWHALIWELNLDIKSPYTIRSIMGNAFDYGKYKASLKKFLPKRTQHN